MKQNIFSVEHFSGEILRDSEVYQVSDNTSLESMTVSKTQLYPGQTTSGHSHPQEEVYNFSSGVGQIRLDNQVFNVSAGTIVTIPSGVFHQVVNTGKDDLVFICVFQKYQRES